MDKISQLLAEAKPLYLRRQKEKRALISSLVSLSLILGIWLVKPTPVTFNDTEFDNYFTALYLNDKDSYTDTFDSDNILPLNTYGLYEV